MDEDEFFPEDQNPIDLDLEVEHEVRSFIDQEREPSEDDSWELVANEQEFHSILFNNQTAAIVNDLTL